MADVPGHTFDRAEFIAAGAALDASIGRNYWRFDTSTAFNVFDSMMKELKDEEIDPLTWIEGHVPDNLRAAPFLTRVAHWENLRGVLPQGTVSFTIAEFLQAGMDEDNAVTTTFLYMVWELQDQGLDAREWVENGAPEYLDDADFATYLANCVEFAAKYLVKSPPLPSELPFTPQMFAAICRTIETVPCEHDAWYEFWDMTTQLLIKDLTPWAFLADNVTEHMTHSLFYRGLFGAIDSPHPRPLLIPDDGRPPSSFSPGMMPDIGPGLIQTAYELHVKLSFGVPTTAAPILRGLLRDLYLADIDIPQYFEFWLNQPDVMPGIPQNVRNGPGVFRIIANNHGKPDRAIMDGVHEHYKYDRPGHIRLVESLPTADEPIANDEVCPICLEGFDNCEDKPDTIPVKTPCGHIFMKGCLTEALVGRNLSCPMCRQNMAEVLFQAAVAPGSYMV